MNSATGAAPASIDPAVSQVERVPLASLSPEEFHRRYRVRSRPVVITGALDGISAWHLDFLVDKLGERKYPVSVFGRDYRRTPKRDWSRLCDVQENTVREYAALLRDGTASERFMYFAQIRLGGTPLSAILGEPVERVRARCGFKPRGDLQLWLGPSGHTSPLHFDSGDGTLMQLRGAKHVVLFPPSQTANLYLFPYFSKVSPRFSRVDTDRPDFGVFPKYRDALRNRVETVLAQGEILFIPFNWWHDVTALGDDYVVSVNRSWLARPAHRHFCHARSAIFYLRSKAPRGLALRSERVLQRLFAARAD